MIEYDDTNLQRLFAELEPKQRVKALKSGFRKEAQNVRKTAVNNLRSTGINDAADLSKGIRAVVFQRTAGFRVTIGTQRSQKYVNKKTGAVKIKKAVGFHTNRKGMDKPILIWAEAGTELRQTKSSRGRSRMFTARKRGSHSTGRMKRYGFMEQTLNDVRGSVTNDVHELVMENVKTISRKYGCI